MSEKERQSGDIELSTRSEVNAQQAEPMLPPPATEKQEPPKASLHPAFYIGTWISLSGLTILFNKWLLSTKGFSYPILLTAWHLGFATLMTQLMARFTTMLDSRKNVPMTGRVYLRSIMPIGLMFSLSLICGNQAYLYLSVSFIQMLKATTPVVTLIASWVLRVAEPSMKTLGNVSLIVVGVMIASVGEIKFVMLGFVFQALGIIFEATRLVMIQKLLSGAEFKMDPLVSLYYFAPICAIMNGTIALFLEVPRMHFSEIQDIGYSVLLANAMVAFLLNVSVVFLIGKTSSLVMTLSGVLKDILLVMCSMLIFRDPVSGLQAFGYAIALAGLVYYKLGADKIKEHLAGGQRAWADFGARRPAARKLTVAGAIITTFIVMLFVVSAGGYVPEEYDPAKQGLDRLHKAMGQTNTH